MGFPRGTAGRRIGYTLVELMMIVTIIGISVMAFAPGFSRAMADRRVSTAARELIRIGRRARSDTFGYLRAHLVWLSPTERRIQLLRAPTSSCLLTVWTPVSLECNSAGANCLEDLSLSTWSAGGAGIRLYEETRAGADVKYETKGRALCFSPSGITYYGQGTTLADATGTLSDTISDAIPGGFVYTMHAAQDEGAPTASSRVHRVLFPLGASPRSLR